MAASKRQATGAGEPRRACGCAAGAALRLSLPTLPSPLSSLPFSRRAFTLIEMLVVISILVLLAAVTVPNVRPALESRRVRETARSVEAFLNRARVDAIERGLPVGVEFVRADLQKEACVMLRQVVTQPIYTGEDSSSMVYVQQDTPQTTPPTKVRVLPSGTFSVSTDELIQFGSPAWNPAAPTYRITGPGTGSELKAQLISQGPALPWLTGTWSAAQQFAVYRQPTASGSSPLPGAVAPLQLPESMCIDLFDSGTGDDPDAFAPSSSNASSVVIMFGPTGTVKEIIATNILGTGNVTQRLYFLVGRRDRLPAAASYSATRGPVQHEDGLDNWQDLNNLWVSIVPRTGMTVTVENTLSSTLAGARGLAQTAQNMGGR